FQGARVGMTVAPGARSSRRRAACIRAIVHGAPTALTEIRRGERKIVTPRRQRLGNALIPKDRLDGIGLASYPGEGAGSRPWAFVPLPLVATFGRMEPAPIFFARCSRRI